MVLILNRVSRLFLMLVCIIAMSGCVDRKRASIMNSEKNMQAVCFGEHEVNLPERFGLRKLGSSVTFYYGRDADFKTVEFQVVGEKVSPQEFIATVEHRAAQIASKANEKTNASMLVANETSSDGIVLLRYFKRRLSTRAHVHEIHRLVDGTHIALKANSYEGKTEPVEVRLKYLAAAVSATSDAPGFCLGPVTIDSESDYQLATIHYRDKTLGHRDVALEIEVNTLPQNSGEPRLISRLGGNLLGLGMKPRVLQKGKSQLAGMPAEQWLGRESDEKRVTHLFVVDSYPETPAPRTPGLQITLRTGGVPRSPVASGLRPYIDSTTHGEHQDPVTSSLSDEDAIALWEAMTASVRPR